MVKTTMVRLVAVGTVSALAACGGGGSSGGSSGGGDQTETQRPTDLGLKLDPDGYADRRVAITTEAAAEAILGVYDSGRRTYDLASEVRETISARNPSSADGNELTFDCLNDGSLIITFNSNADRDDERWLFSDCELETESFDGIRLNGDYHYVDEVSTDSNGTVLNTGFQFFNLTGTLLTTGEPIAISGLDDWSLTTEEDEDRREVYGAEALEFRIGDDYFATADAETIIESTATSPTEVSITSTLIGSDMNGFINISTTALIVEASGTQECPQQGVLLLDGEGSADAEIRYGDSTGVGEAATLVFNGGSNTLTFDEETCQDLIY